MNDRVISIYQCYRRAMADAGWKTKLPINTDPTKTYAYRAVKRFLNQVDEWQLDEPLIYILVREVVKYGKRNGLLNKGTALLNMQSVLDICYDYLCSENNKTQVLLAEIQQSFDFLAKHAVGNLIDVLISKEHRGGYTNITRWYRLGNLGLNFISLSSNCRKALNLLTDERSEFPSDIILFRNRMRIFNDRELYYKISLILNDDLLKTGIPTEHLQ